MSNYAAESDLKSARGVETLDFAKKADWANLELDIYRIDIRNYKRLCTMNWLKKLMLFRRMSNLVKKADYSTKTKSKILNQDKYITTDGF